MGDFIETGTLAGPMADAKPLPAGANPNLIPNLQAARWNEHRSALLDLRSHTSGWVNVRSYEDFAAALAAVGPDGAKMLINVLEPFAGYSGTAVTGAPRLIFGTNAPRFAAANGQGDDSAILITRALTGDSLFSHAVRDESTFNTATDGAYASIDAYPRFSGGTVYNHFRGFQWRGEYLGSGSVGVMDGFASSLIHNGSGTVESAYGLHVYDPLGTGPITYNIGVYVRPLTRGTARNYAFWADTNPVYAGGHIKAGGELQSTGGLTHFDSGGGIAVYGLSGSPEAAIKAYSDAAGTEKTLAIQPAGVGKVVIGDVTPGAKLDVNGNIRARDEILSTGGLSAFSSGGGVAMYGMAGSPQAAIKAYSNSSGTEKDLALNPAGVGKVGVGTIEPQTTLDVNGSFRVAAPTVPATATSAGKAGTIAWDSGFVYVCVADNTWKRAALTTW
jgi:hypothetical protein